MNRVRVSAPQCRLFFFPPAGRGASIYAKWVKAFPPGLDICPIQLPGRENRLRETPFTSMPDLLNGMIPAIERLLDVPFAFFGHSMGAIIGFELARELLKRGLDGPVHLFASARRAPHLKEPHPPIAHLPDEPFLKEVQRRYGGIPEGVIQDSEMKGIILPTLRADFSLLESYEYSGNSPLSCHITVLGGLQDLDIEEEELEAWKEHTTYPTRVQLLPGDHFFLLSAADKVIRTVIQDMEEFHSLRAVRCQ